MIFTNDFKLIFMFFEVSHVGVSVLLLFVDYSSLEDDHSANRMKLI